MEASSPKLHEFTLVTEPMKVKKKSRTFNIQRVQSGTVNNYQAVFKTAINSSLDSIHNCIIQADCNMVLETQK